MPNTLQDLRYAVRTLSGSPLFVGVAVLSLALGIGANTAIFTLIDQLLLRMLPVKNPRELVLLTGEGEHYGGNNGPNRLSYPMYADIRGRNTVFSGMFSSSEMDMSVNFRGHAEHVTGEFVSGNYFPVLGVGAAAGRVFNGRTRTFYFGQFWRDSQGSGGDGGNRFLVSTGFHAPAFSTALLVLYLDGLSCCIEPAQSMRTPADGNPSIQVGGKWMRSWNPYFQSQSA